MFSRSRICLGMHQDRKTPTMCKELKGSSCQEHNEWEEKCYKTEGVCRVQEFVGYRMEEGLF